MIARLRLCDLLFWKLQNALLLDLHLSSLHRTRTLLTSIRRMAVLITPISIFLLHLSLAQTQQHDNNTTVVEGAPKQWYGVPGHQYLDFERQFRAWLPQLFRFQPDLLFELVTMLSPHRLRQARLCPFNYDFVPGVDVYQVRVRLRYPRRSCCLFCAPFTAHIWIQAFLSHNSVIHNRHALHPITHHLLHPIRSSFDLCFVCSLLRLSAAPAEEGRDGDHLPPGLPRRL